MGELLLSQAYKELLLSQAYKELLLSQPYNTIPLDQLLLSQPYKEPLLSQLYKEVLLGQPHEQSLCKKAKRARDSTKILGPLSPSVQRVSFVCLPIRFQFRELATCASKIIRSELQRLRKLQHTS